MARVARKEKKIRLNLDLTPEARNRLERLRTECDADSMSEVIRKALQALEEFITHQNAGGDIILKAINDKDADVKLKII